MKHIISTREILGTWRRGKDEYEVCATADADYDENNLQLCVELNSFVRPADVRLKERQLSEPWLPRRERLTETSSRSEAGARARDVFRRWAAKVRDSVPIPLHTNPQP